MRASELRPGQFFEFANDAARTRCRRTKDGYEFLASDDLPGHIDVTPLNVHGWDDEPQSDKRETNEEIVAEQLAFVEWLKSHNAYSEWASADAMRMGHRVWKLAQQAELEREVVTAKGFLSHAEADKAALTAENAALLDDNVRIALERDRLRELLRECEYWLRGRLLSEHPLMVKVNAELAKGE